MEILNLITPCYPDTSQKKFLRFFNFYCKEFPVFCSYLKQDRLSLLYQKKLFIHEFGR